MTTAAKRETKEVVPHASSSFVHIISRSTITILFYRGINSAKRWIYASMLSNVSTASYLREHFSN
jgi:hypothetical protein